MPRTRIVAPKKGKSVPDPGGDYRVSVCGIEGCEYSVRSMTGARLHARSKHGIQHVARKDFGELFVCRGCSVSFQTREELLSHNRWAGHLTS